METRPSCCIRFFLYDIAFGDVVRTDPAADRMYVVAKVIEPSCRFVFRVRFVHGMLTNREMVVAALIDLEVLIEALSPTLLA